MTAASAPGPIRIAIIGGGSRGSTYSRHAVSHGAQITALVEPDEARREAFRREFDRGQLQVLGSWQELAARGRELADAAAVTTPDDAHTEPVVGLAEAGLHLLLEKPMAQTEAEAIRIVEAAESAGVILAVCHVMRYSVYTRAMKELVTSGKLGEIVSIEHLEPIGWWHFAHSFVRGNWRNEAESNPMLMAKSSHDIDWLAHIIDKPEKRVASFGSLLHFRPENRPEGAAERCLDCPLQDTCAYSATVLYRGFLDDPDKQAWPLQVLTPEVTPENLERALAEGPYGRCVYSGGNDVADHQVVSIEYEDGSTASFTAVAFTDLAPRKTRIFGTTGWAQGDGSTIEVQEFDTRRTYTIDPYVQGDASAAGGHGGADEELVKAFLGAVATGDESGILSGPRDSLASHQVVWAAERARHEGSVVSLR